MVAGLGTGQQGALIGNGVRKPWRFPLCIQKSQAGPARSLGRGIRVECLVWVTPIYFLISPSLNCLDQASLPPEGPRYQQTPVLRPVGMGPWQGKASTLFAKWTLAGSLAGCARQEHPAWLGRC